MTVAGANGGSGVVIVRITLALETAVPVPTVSNVIYTGENIVAFDPKIGYIVVGGDTNGTDVGEYSFDVKPADDFTWFDGTTDPTNIVWHITKKAIDFPTIATGLQYTGEIQTGVTYPTEYDQFCEFSDDSVIKAVNACTYRFIVSLVEENNTMWADGSIAAYTNYWTISPVTVEKPTPVEGLVYSGTNSIVFTEYDGVVYKSGETNSVNAGSFDYTVALDNPVGYTNYVWAGESGEKSVENVRIDWEIKPYVVDVPVPLTGLVYNGSPQNAFENLDWSLYELVTGSTTNETEGGTYEAVFHLTRNSEAENDVWNTTPAKTSLDQTVPWSISADTNEIYSLKLDGWRLDATPNAPTIDSKWGADTVVYSYGFGDDAESVTSWTNDTDAITTVGTWVLRAVIPEKPSWTAVTNYTTFVMWDDPSMLFRNRVEIFVKGTTSELSNFVVPIRISEDSMQGFYYDDANSAGLVFIDNLGNLLSYDVDTWNTSGESVVWVKLVSLPTDGMPITMYWNLKEGYVAPKNTPTEVWSDYAGVWHMGGANDSAAGASTGTLGNKTTAVDGVFGGALSASVQGEPLILATASEAVNSVTGGAFTVSFYTKYNSTSHGSAAQYLFSRRTVLGDAGYALCINGGLTSTATQFIDCFGEAGGRYTITDAKPMTKSGSDKWVRNDVVYTPNRLYWYINGEELYWTYNMSSGFSNGTTGLLGIGGLAAAGSDSNINGAMDEFRIRSGTPDVSRITAEYKYQTDLTMITNGIVYLDGFKLDYWVVEPEMDKTQWDMSDAEKGQITNYGQLRYGEVTNYIYSVYDESEVYSAISEITHGGTYRAVFARVPTEDFQPLEYVIEFRITQSKPYYDIVGNGGDSGRVLLMNNHTGESGVPDIDYQGWYDADNAGAKSSSTAIYWHHVNLSAPGVTTFNLQNGTESVLYAFGGRRLWHLENCRHGNTFPTSTGTALSPAQNYLPFSTYSKRITEHRANQRATTRSTVGQLVMLNTTDAVVYSSCFTNGIGTIYFDAVNGWCRNSEDYNNYKIDVQYATNTVDNLAPTDDNCIVIETNIVNEVEEVTTNYYGKLMDCWHTAEMIPFVRDTTDGTGTFDRLDGTSELVLAVTHGGTMGNFYRVAVPIDISRPVRFRIRRTTCTPHDTDFNIDAGGFILLDNIIASLPAMGGSLETLGHFDKDKTRHEILGWELATSVPYPSAADSNIAGGAKPSFFTNAGDGAEPKTNDFFQSVTMHYRWRYLNQALGPWSAIDLNPNNGFKALSKFDLPGRPCDVEYWYEYTLQAPYYEYVDYSGIGKQIDYSEERGTLTNALNSATVLPSAGTDWFFRVREGKSDYSGLNIVFRRGGSETPEPAVPMMLAGDHVWRGFLQTKEDQAGDITYRIEALNYQTEPFAEYSCSTNYLYCKTDKPKFPVSDSLESGSEESWSTLTLDAVTGYVMFQIDDSSMALTIVHADYQDANNWSDARNREGRDKNGNPVQQIFVGTSTTNAYKVGVSPMKQTFFDDFSSWGNMAATNESWTFPIGLQDIKSNHMHGRKAYETFASGSDTNGVWEVGQGMWVAKQYYDDRDNAGVALQMEGNGKGYLQFASESKAPRGLESISFNARLGQFVRFDDFAYYYAGDILGLSNYTFVARTAFDLKRNKGFKGNASLSVIANYLPNKGCYEARWEWLGNNSNANRGQRLCLYRWNVTPSGTKSPELIIAKTNTVFNVEELSSLANANSQRFAPLFISVSNDVPNNCTWVAAGIRRCGVTLGKDPIGTDALNSDNGRNANWLGVCFKDTDGKRLIRGSYGVLSANCDGVFARPEFSHTVQIVTPGSGKTRDTFENSGLAQVSNLQDITNCAKEHLQDAEYPGWNIIPGRMTTTYTDTAVNAVMSAPLAQKLQIFLGTAGRADWGSEPYWFTNLTSFGESTITVPFYTTKDCSVRLEVAGTIEDVRTDVVIDTVVMKQWRGGNWNGSDVQAEKIAPSWTTAGSGLLSPALTNFVFTSCWTKDNDVLMSAKRSNLDLPCAIRSPLMDYMANNGIGGDGYHRGIGLGMVAIEYANAQSNTVLSLQVATNNVEYSTVDLFDKSFDERYWDPITNYDFSAMSPAERTKGVLNTYLGFHSVTGMLRIVVSSNVVANVANTMDTSAFGEVTIKRITCSDEPPVDVHSWWGWNLRTLGGDEDAEKRMLLYDFPSASSAAGLSIALNNSVDAENCQVSKIDYDDREAYIQHKPFVQTPTFTSNIVGEVSFKARKYDESDPTATITVYGSIDASETNDGKWERVAGAVFMVSNAWYETYSCKMDARYKAFRLAVAGVEGVVESNNDPPSGANVPPPRVLLDEMFVSEAVNATMGFKNVGCFRKKLAETTERPGVPSSDEQPICQEAWGVQCEIYGAQLASDIAFDITPTVKLHWYEGVEPWGYENWKDRPGANSAQLSRATDTGDDRYVYRSSMSKSPDAVVPMSLTAPTYVQYTLEVVFYTKENPALPLTNWLTAADWPIPEWYRPLDLNATFGKGRSFSAYNIIDNVAPGWAWINEVNVFGNFKNWTNTDEDCQYVEIAQPPESDISGWTLRLLEAQRGNDLVLTNVLVKFGPGGPSGTKAISEKDASANMSFRVIANEATRTSGKVEAAGGEVDAVWKVDNPTQVFTVDGVISYYDPLVLQLVRTSGIIEHEIIVEGTNFLESLEIEEPDFIKEIRDFIASRQTRSAIIIPGYDYGGEGNSLSVTQNFGRCGMEEPVNDWTCNAKKTPGHLNDGQYINPDHPVPAGEDLLVYLTVQGDHIEQSLDGVVFTNGMFTTVVSKGSLAGTNVFYRVDPWYVLGSVKTGSVSILDLVSPRVSPPVQPYEYKLSEVAKGISNNVTVVASAALNPRLETEWGIPADDPYRDAIVAWLEGGVDMYGNKFGDVESGEIRLAKFRHFTGLFVTNLTFREMYWLDMDPTIGNLALLGGVKEPPTTTNLVEWTSATGTLVLTNLRMGVYMMITNENETIVPPEHKRGANADAAGTHWTPYVIRGREPGSTSVDYNPNSDTWNSVTFKVVGMLLNGETSFDNINNKVPLRFFVFNEDSFGADGMSRIEVLDPFSPLSLGYQAGWKRWWDANQICPVGLYWSIDTRLPSRDVLMLKKENYYGE